jgi:hypothetical protein
MDMDAETFIGSYLFGLTTALIVDDQGVMFDGCDEDDLRALGAASDVAHRIAAKAEAPVDCALSRLAVMTGALLLAQRGPQGARIVPEWRSALSEYMELADSPQAESGP